MDFKFEGNIWSFDMLPGQWLWKVSVRSRWTGERVHQDVVCSDEKRAQVVRDLITLGAQPATERVLDINEFRAALLRPPCAKEDWDYGQA